MNHVTYTASERDQRTRGWTFLGRVGRSHFRSHNCLSCGTRCPFRVQLSRNFIGHTLFIVFLLRLIKLEPDAADCTSRGVKTPKSASG